MFRFFRNIIDSLPCGVCSVANAALILWLTLAPHPVGEVDVPLFEGADKVVHAIMFGWFTWMLWIDTRKHTRRCPSARATVACMAVSVAFGALVEVLQSSMSLGRSMEAADLVADAVGAVIAAVGLMLYAHHHS